MNFRVVWDQPEPCPYREGQTASFPMRLPDRVIDPLWLDARLEQGDRRSGHLLYVPTCPACNACEPLRVSIPEFAPSRSQRRVQRKNEDVRVEVVRPKVDATRLELFNRHKLERGLSRSGEPLTASAYRQWLVDSCCPTVEVDYFVRDRLVAVSVLDVGVEGASSVYHYFDPSESARSLGVFSVLAEIELLHARNYRWYYLGLYVSDCNNLVYKADYRPHQRRVMGTWVPSR